MLFHYHFWTPNVEETERFYKELGFEVTLRVGKFQGEFQKFNPPLNWNDFRDHNILFRVIEVRKGSINITFGYGKKVMFDHIGFLVSQKEYNAIYDRAKEMNWSIDEGDRRTFITTPYGFKIELQTNMDVVNDQDDSTLVQLNIMVKDQGLEKDLSLLFNTDMKSVTSLLGDMVTVKEAVIQGISTSKIDPNGVEVINISH
ncbi:VOC family protein [Chengkuizengella axinellae]|uniref:VOC domain-containing protein n=1 Tax=Chengkuizengella axinellae TaxID=3064388 RepID=A0ABT9J530_9BACL|nr:hypothetical protein [Chengkuizengella sp. 2205SS18-9]MDP5276721.1 hypothetical protein [Chengkuizengella sp. 2205SS18-9]